jgi:hypothetical protein
VSIDESAAARFPAGAGADRSERFGSERTDWSEPPDDLVTRLLCAATYLREGFADRVGGELIQPTRGALSPLWHVDAVQLARHAAAAQRLRRTRDVWLASALGYLLLSGTLALVLTVVNTLDLLHAVVVWLVLWVWVYCVAVGLVYAQYKTARRAAIAVTYEPETARPEPLARHSVEQSLADLNHTNVVLFRGESSPFVGSGVQLDSWHLTLDISKGAVPRHDRGGAPGTPDDITGADLQEALLATMPQRISPRPASGNRLYVRGGSNALSVPLFRVGPTEADPIEAVNFRRPVNRVPEEQVRQYLNEPSEAARAYTYFQHSAWGGQVLVTLFVRAFVSNQTLFVEGLVYALRPLQSSFYAVRGLPVDGRSEVTSLLQAAVPEALSLLFTAPTRLLNSVFSGRARQAQWQASEAEIEHRRDIDFGALSSLREQVANYNLADPFAAMDERMYYQIFNRRALECIGLFLEDKHVEMSEFNGQMAGIIGNTTAKAASIYGAALDNGISPTDGGD